jgi:hypothetical protein
LTDWQARSQAQLNFHFHASLSAGTLAKLAARQQNGEAASGFSLASLKRRAVNHHLLERISQYVAKGHSLEKASPDYEELCHYGTIIETAASGPRHCTSAPEAKRVQGRRRDTERSLDG